MSSLVKAQRLTNLTLSSISSRTRRLKSQNRTRSISSWHSLKKRQRSPKMKPDYKKRQFNSQKADRMTFRLMTFDQAQVSELI